MTSSGMKYVYSTFRTHLHRCVTLHRILLAATSQMLADLTATSVLCLHAVAARKTGRLPPPIHVSGPIIYMQSTRRIDFIFEKNI